MALPAEMLVDAWRAAEAAGHGKKQSIYSSTLDIPPICPPTVCLSWQICQYV